MIKSDAPMFGRVLTAMVTPFDDAGKVDFKATERLVHHLLANGTDSIVVAGTTGESPTLEADEKRELLRCVLQTANGKAKVIMGTGSYSTAASVKASQEAENLGADGLLVVAPYYNKPSQQGMIRHFGEVASSTSLPIIVYNIPTRTGVNITADTMLAIAAANSNIHALKDSTGSVDQTSEIASWVREDFRIYSGDDYLTLPFLAVGACGIVSVASHLVGNEIQAMIAAFFNGNLEESRKLHYQYLHLFKGLFAAPNPTCVKFALQVLGVCKSVVRLPLIELDDEQKATLTRLLKESNIAVQSVKVS